MTDCNHWADPRKPAAQALQKQVEDAGRLWAYNVPLNRSRVGLVADAMERAGSADREKIAAALAASDFSGHIMPYGPTRFVGGQNQGAAPVNTQVQDRGIKVIFPAEFADAAPIFPAKA